jgi:hypothetical protein
VRAKTFTNATSAPSNAHFSPLSASSPLQPQHTHNKNSTVVVVVMPVVARHLLY